MTKVYRCRHTGDVMITSDYDVEALTDANTGELIPCLITCKSKNRTVTVEQEEPVAAADPVAPPPGAMRRRRRRSSITINNIVEKFNMAEISMDKEDFREYLTDYCKTTLKLISEDKEKHASEDEAEYTAFQMRYREMVEWLTSHREKMHLYTTVHGLGTGHPSLAFAMRAKAHSASNDFIFIRGGLELVPGSE